jgi:ubiquinone/menaquinone biosynthesis C-methylase UbiE
MINPWLTITSSDYENHMIEVGQSQILNDLTDLFLKKYKPKSFALIGCATGNGLEHINNKVTTNVYAIDINPDYLLQTRIRYENNIQNLITFCIDLQKDKFDISNIDLAFCGLILEYVEPDIVLKKISEILNVHGKIVIVIQKNIKTSFVTKTKYKSLESLSKFAKEIGEKNVTDICKRLNLKMIYRKEIKLNEKKSFVVLAFKNGK